MKGSALDRDLWVRRFTPGPPGAARLACFPHAGGTASFYLPVSRALAPVADVLALQYPGRQERRKERCLDSIDEMAALSGTDRAILGNPELSRTVLPAIRGDYNAVETYQYRDGPLLGCPVTAFTGDADPRVTLNEAAAWQEHTSAGYELRVFPGGHFFLAHHQHAISDMFRARLRARSLL